MKIIKNIFLLISTLLVVQFAFGGVEPPANPPLTISVVNETQNTIDTNGLNYQWAVKPTGCLGGTIRNGVIYKRGYAQVVYAPYGCQFNTSLLQATYNVYDKKYNKIGTCTLNLSAYYDFNGDFDNDYWTGINYPTESPCSAKGIYYSAAPGHSEVDFTIHA